MFVNENLKHLLEKSSYSNNDKFAFLPGHKILLKTLKNYLCKDKKVKKNEKSSLTKSGESVVSEKTLEEKEELKISLIDKIKKYCEKVGLKESYTKENIISVSSYINCAGKEALRYCVECTFCREKTFPCTYIKHWQISNLEKHLKSHFEADRSLNLLEIPIIHADETNGKERSAISKVIAAEELENILNAENDNEIDDINKSFENTSF